MAGWFDPGPTWPLWPSEVAQSSHPCFAPYNSLHFFPFPFLSDVISACRTEKRPSMESCQDSSALELELHEFMPKKPNFEFELLKCNKAPFPCLFSPSSFPSAQNRWQMWRSLVMWACSCWAGKMEASTHFLENPKNSSSSQLVPITTMKDKQKGEKGASADMKRPKQLHNTGTSQKLITGFLGVFIFLVWGGGEPCVLPASLFFPAIS